MPRNKLIRYSMADKVFLTADFIILLLFFIILAYPLLFIISASFDSANASLSTSLLPRNFSLQGYKAVFEYEYIWIGYLDGPLYSGRGSGDQ